MIRRRQTTKWLVTCKIIGHGWMGRTVEAATRNQAKWKAECLCARCVGKEPEDVVEGMVTQLGDAEVWRE